MIQPIYTWAVIYEYAIDDGGKVDYYTCTWEELLNQLSNEREPLVIIRTGLYS